MSKDEPDKLIAARNGSPLVIGLGEGENFIGSDVSAIMEHTRNILYLDDGEVAEISKNNLSILTIKNKLKLPRIKKLNIELEEIEKGGFETFMLKEIYEQPRSIIDTLRGRILLKKQLIKLRGFNESISKFKKTNPPHSPIFTSGSLWLSASTCGKSHS